MVPVLGLLLTGISITSGLIIPEELPSLLSLLYSNIPPVKKGTDSRLGFGFRLGPHADFQVLLEIGPQINTAPVGPDGEPPGKRDTIKMQNPQTLVHMINTWKMPLGQDNPEPDSISDSQAAASVNNADINDSLELKSTQKTSSGGGWIDSWRNEFGKGSHSGKIKFKPVPGIDFRRNYHVMPRVAQTRWDQSPTATVDQTKLNLTNQRLNYVDQLKQLYRTPSLSTDVTCG